MPFIYAIAGPEESVPQNLLAGFQNIWFFDASFGVAILGFQGRIPLILVTIALSLILAVTYNVTWLTSFLPI